MLKYLLIFIFVFAGFIFTAQAQEDDPFDDLTYPIAELGNCTDKENCLAYCDSPDNMTDCLNFAREHKLMPEEDIEMGEKMLAAGQKSGPGGCKGVKECGTYCDDIFHLKECLTFAEKNNMMQGEELEEAKKVAAALDRGVQLPPCNSKGECDRICRQPENMKTCILFAKEAGLMSPEEVAETDKVLIALEKGAIPPACGGKEECDAYCGTDEHFEECVTFAEAAGFMSADELAMARKTGGKGPGGCRGKEACETFCNDPANGEACINFALENGFMSPEEGEQAKKMMTAGMNIMQGGPGGCKGEEECKSYCDDMSHMEECVDFAVKAGMMSEEDAARARKMTEAGMLGEMTPEEAEQARRGRGMMQQQQQEDEFQGSREEFREEFQRQMPPEGMVPPEIEQQIQQEIQYQTQQQMEQQIRQQMEQQIQQFQPPAEFVPPVETVPPSTLDMFKKFLGNAGEALLGAGR